jgi:AcrR family transcriptional regulator
MSAGERATGGRDSGRERVLETAYELFSRHGTRAVGVDRIIAESGVAKMTLYRNFASKDDLILAFLERREERWTREWLQATVERRAETPAQRLLAIFDPFAEWFARDDFEGCSFINVMLEIDDPGSPVRRESVRQLSEIRGFIGGLAKDAGIDDVDGFARQWHILMKGCIVAAAEGDRLAAARARELGTLLLAHHAITA